MSLINYFKRKKTATTAKDRLQIIIAQERSVARSSADFLPMLRQEIIEVIAKYTHIDVEQVTVDLHKKDNSSILELNVLLPEEVQKVV